MAEVKRYEKDELVDSPAKKIKLDVEIKDAQEKSIDVIENWQNFEVKRVLNNNIVRKQVWLEGSFKGHENTAIVLLEKKTFPDESENLKNFFDDETLLKHLFDNDAYGSYECFPIREHNGLNTTVIYPATQKHLEKFSKKEINIVTETPELYKKVTIPKVIGQQLSLQWVENILNHKSEADRIIYEDTDSNNGFVLIPDLKWDGNLNTLNVLAISRKKINSIRDLNASHLTLLKNIRDKGTEAIVKKYDISSSKLRIYFHYLPSYYHLHVHFTQLSVEDAGIYAEKAHLLSTVISNIELLPDYYQKVTLQFAVFNPDLVEDYKQAVEPNEKTNEPEEEC
ncbi:m7GpppX diphosphatase [Venturia canescens]|uniref:m7GpppX diphosphatase n=1 Tax=Venturia canescens TaxID=32260 RepID=UPI001C9C4F71|nr:m7GpppX diphosphatase [Venturia canescens]